MRRLIWLLVCVPITVSCGMPRYNEGPELSIRIIATQPASHPVVTIRNDTNRELRVWYHANSWGWFSLSFCAAMDDGRIVHIKPGTNIAFTSNAPVYETIGPGKETTRNTIDLHDGYWDIPKNVDLDKVRFICAVYFIERSKESTEKGVWTGVVVSPWVTVPVQGKLTTDAVEKRIPHNDARPAATAPTDHPNKSPQPPANGGSGKQK
jgi:hypothetical protein